MSKWIEINSDCYTYTEVMYLGGVGLIRTTNMISTSISLIEISAKKAQALCQEYSTETVDGNKELTND